MKKRFFKLVWRTSLFHPVQNLAWLNLSFDFKFKGASFDAVRQIYWFAWIILIESFKVFHCSVINVLLPSSAVFLSDSLFIIAPLSSFVNNFFHLFQKSFWGLPPGSLLPVFLFRFGACRLISDSFVILSCPASFVNSFFIYFLILFCLIKLFM